MNESLKPEDGWTLVPRADPRAPINLPAPFYNRYNDPEGYDPDPELVTAVNVALLLGQPLLLTGEPGCGKTTLASWLARQLGLEGPLVCNVKSSTIGRDLLYEFDELARFRDAQASNFLPQQEYLAFSALGLAILFSAGPDAEPVRSTVPPPSTMMAPPQRHSDLYKGEFSKSRRCVVLVDELDKAPRDTPNDLLHEIDQMSFYVRELGLSISGDSAHRPIVVITSNSEKTLPEPFLRRCVYHHIFSPSPSRRREIIVKRNATFARRGKLFDEAMELFEKIRTQVGRAPGTSELLAWLDVLENFVAKEETSQGSSVVSLSAYSDEIRLTLGALIKTREDLERVTAYFPSDARSRR